ncbi:MAG: hypothetical protein E6600_09825 [Anaerocolumna aminovalerica]|jgi:hypothetical protein|uniref:hypothetical protein n=1 Tax=Anaerocolumna aminovalerica TaxID=1527 RepID=UPI000BE251D8|nr:hypothetical protein [Anaerocolumna aminovalerica]MDU6264786.1 hypothetical protein [Anaerocolumna aminovalerica]
MITIFNRRELVTTYSMENQANIREILKSNKIDYRLKTITKNSRIRGNIAIIGQNINQAYEYIFYVHKKDLEYAKSYIK